MALQCRLLPLALFLLFFSTLNGCTPYNTSRRDQQHPLSHNTSDVNALTRAGLAVPSPALSDKAGNTALPEVIEKLYNQSSALAQPPASADSPTIRIHRVSQQAPFPPQLPQTSIEDSPLSEQNKVGSDSITTSTPDGLETSDTWASPLWGDTLTVSRAPSPHNELHGQVLRIRLKKDAPDRDKGVAQLSLTPPVTITDKSSLNLTCFTPTNRQPVRIAVAVSIGTDYTYYESQPVLVKPGEVTNLRIQFDTKSWKTDATNWRYETSVPAGAPARQIMLLVYNAESNLDLLVDAIQIHPTQGL